LTFFDFLLTFPVFRRYCTHFTQKSRVQIPEVSERFDASFLIFSLASKKKLFAFYETASFSSNFLYVSMLSAHAHWPSISRIQP